MSLVYRPGKHFAVGNFLPVPLSLMLPSAYVLASAIMETATGRPEV